MFTNVELRIGISGVLLAELDVEIPS